MPFIGVPDGDGTNMERLFELRPQVYAAWRELLTAVKATADERRYELATLAAARQLRSSYCCLAHGKVLAEKFYDFDSVPALPEGLDDADRAIMAFAERVAADATAITEGDVEELRDHGLSDGEIFDVVLAATIRCFFSKTLDALGVQPDPEFAKLDPAFHEPLTVGRPIETAQG
jgi:alkylhydroperoxidase family enzyme